MNVHEEKSKKKKTIARGQYNLVRVRYNNIILVRFLARDYNILLNTQYTRCTTVLRFYDRGRNRSKKQNVGVCRIIHIYNIKYSV